MNQSSTGGASASPISSNTQNQADTDLTARRLPLQTKGLVTLIDAQDLEWVRRYRWYATSHNRYVSRYERRRVNTPEGTKRISCLFYLHREIMQPGDGQHVDHINGDGLDNRRVNLRLCDRHQNMANQRKQTRETFSRFKGIYHKNNRNNNRWVAKVWHAGRGVYLGTFDTEELAARAYDTAALRLFGEFARLNFPIKDTDQIKDTDHNKESR